MDCVCDVDLVFIKKEGIVLYTQSKTKASRNNFLYCLEHGALTFCSEYSEFTLRVLLL